MMHSLVYVVVFCTHTHFVQVCTKFTTAGEGWCSLRVQCVNVISLQLNGINVHRICRSV